MNIGPAELAVTVGALGAAAALVNGLVFLIARLTRQRRR